MSNMFSHMRYNSKNYDSFLATNWLDISLKDKATKIYSDNGIYIICFFAQREIRSKIIRCDIALDFNPQDNHERTNDVFCLTLELFKNNWYLGQNYPLPVFLAHQKCNIRQGAAEVLYNEILTKGSDIEPEIMIIQNLLLMHH